MPRWSKLIRSHLLTHEIVGAILQVLAANAGIRLDLRNYPGFLNYNVLIGDDTGGTNASVNTLMTNLGTSPKLLKYEDTGDYLALKYRWSPHNGLDYSEELASGSWVEDGVTWTEDGTDIPAEGGVANSWTLSPAASTGNKRIYQLGLPWNVIKAPRCVSCYAKADTHDYFYLGFNTATGQCTAQVFDVANGALGEENTQGNGEVTDAGIEPIGNGWYRCYFVFTHSSITRYDVFAGVSESLTGNTWVAGGAFQSYDGTSIGDVKVAGFQYGYGYMPYINAPSTTPVYGVGVEWDTGEHGYAILHEKGTTNLLLGGTSVDTGEFTFDTMSRDTGNGDTGDTGANFYTPDGHLAARIWPSQDTGQCFATQAVTVGTNTVDYSGFFRSFGNKTYIAPRIYNDTGTYIRVVINPITRTVSSSDSRNDSGTAIAVHSLGNGWGRFHIRTSFDASITNFGIGFCDTGKPDTGPSGNVPNDTGLDTGSGIYVWAFQADTGKCLSSPIPTYNATVTRDADELYLDLSQFADYPGNDEGFTALFDYKYYTNEDTGSVIELVNFSGDTGLADTFGVAITDTGGNIQWLNDGAGKTTASVAEFNTTDTGNAHVDGVRYRQAARVGTDDFFVTGNADYADSGTGTNALWDAGDLDKIYFADTGLNSAYLYDFQLLFTDTGMDNANVQDLTWPYEDTGDKKTGANFLEDEPSGIVVDGMNNRCYVRDSTTQTNTYEGTVPETFTNGTTSYAYCRKITNTRWDATSHNFIDYAQDFDVQWQAVGNASISSGTMTATSGSASAYAQETTTGEISYNIYTYTHRITPDTTNARYLSLCIYSASSYYTAAVFDTLTKTVTETSSAGTNSGVIEWDCWEPEDYPGQLVLSLTAGTGNGIAFVWIQFADQDSNTWAATGIITRTQSGNETVDLHHAQLYLGPGQRDMEEVVTTGSNLAGTEARLDYDPVEQCRGILHEPSTTNTCTYSAYPSSWTNQGSTDAWTVDASELSPINQPYVLQTASSGASEHRMYSAGTGSASSETVMISVFAKAGTHQYMNIKWAGSNNGFGVTYDLLNGTVTDETTFTGGTIDATGMLELDDGWWLCWVTGNRTGTNGIMSVGTPDSSTPSYSGETHSWTAAGTETIKFACPQVITGSILSSPILTYGSSVTRDQDELNWTSVPSSVSSTAWSFNADFKAWGTSTTAGGGYATVSNGTNNYLQVFHEWGSDRIYAQTRNNNALVSNISAASVYDSGVRQGAAMASTTDDYAGYVDGSQLGTDTLGTFQPIAYDNVGVGLKYGTTSIMSRPMKLYYCRAVPKREDNTTLEARSYPYWPWVNRDLLDTYEYGIAVDGENNTISIKDRKATNNKQFYHDINNVFTNGTTSPKLCLQSNGTYKWGPHTEVDYSDDFSSWIDTSTGATISGNTLTANTASGGHLAYVNAENIADQVVTFVARITPGTHDFVAISRYWGSGRWYGSVFDLSGAGSASQSGEGATSGTYIDAGVVNNGDGSFDCWVTGSLDVGNMRFQVVFAPAATGNSWSTAGTFSFTTAGTETFDVEWADAYRGTYQAGKTPLSTTTAPVYGVARDYDQDESTYTILHEPSATNLNDGNSYTAVSNATITTDGGVTAPDGTSSDRITCTSSGLSGAGINNFTVSTSTEYTWSVYVNAPANGWAFMYFINATTPSNGGVYFQLSGAGSVGTNQISGSGVTADIYRLGATDWYRISVTWTSDGTDTDIGAIRLYQADGDGDATVATSATMDFWGWQVETGPVATSPIPTFGSTVTRDQDEIYWNTGQTYAEPVSGVVKVKWLDEPGTATSPFFGFTNDTSPRDSLELRTSAGDVDFLGREADAGNILAANILSTTGITSSTHIFAMAAADNDGAVSVDGGAVTTDVSGTLTWNVSQLSLGNLLSGGDVYIAPMRFYYAFVVPERIADATLVTLATP